MNYPSSLRFLDSFYNYERMLQPASVRWNLDRMKYLLRLAGHPDRAFIPVIIAGTKGKGSTGFFLESILKESGVRVGFYTSPHLASPRERIRLQGKIISETFWTRGLSRIQTVLKRSVWPPKMGFPTYFEIMTLLAAMEFKRAKVDLGIFEVGMGGRLDAVNALSHQLAILTPIDLDHEAVLGNTVAKIAGEKAAVIRLREPVVVSPQNSEAMKVIKAYAGKKRARIYSVPSNGLPGSLAVGLAGDYQRINAGAALKAAELLRERWGIRVTDRGIERGLQASQGWPGRMESFFIKKREWLLDGAHNPMAMEALVRNLKAHYANRPRILVFGTSRDKRAAKMLQILSRYFPEVILTRADHPRSFELERLMAAARGKFKKIYPVSRVLEAIPLAEKMTKAGGLIVAAGSFYVIGEARKRLCRTFI